MNKVILMGRLTADPELANTLSGVSVVRFTIAVNRRFAKEGQQQADFINCTAWRNTAEFICKHFRKGNMIAIVGSIQTRTWEDKESKKQYATNVVVDEVYFTGEKAGGIKPESDSAYDVQSFSNGGFTDMNEPDDNFPF